MVMRINSVVYSAENINRLRAEVRSQPAGPLHWAEQIDQMKLSDIFDKIKSDPSENMSLAGVLDIFVSGVKGGRINYSA
jgi:hypothetical protein